MEQGRDKWTDPRIDDLSDRVTKVGTRMDTRFAEVEGRMDAGFARVGDDLRFLSGRFDALQRTLMQIGGGILAALIALVATQL